MAKLSLHIESENPDELIAFLQKFNDSPAPAAAPAKGKGKPAATVDDDDDDDDEPAKPTRGRPKGKPAATVDDEGDDDDDEDGGEDLRPTLRKELRKLATLTDRKAAVKVLNKFGKTVDSVEAAKIPAALKAIKAAITAASAEDDEDDD